MVDRLGELCCPAATLFSTTTTHAVEVQTSVSMSALLSPSPLVMGCVDCMRLTVILLNTTPCSAARRFLHLLCPGTMSSNDRQRAQQHALYPDFR